MHYWSHFVIKNISHNSFIRKGFFFLLLPNLFLSSDAIFVCASTQLEQFRPSHSKVVLKETAAVFRIKIRMTGTTSNSIDIVVTFNHSIKALNANLKKIFKDAKMRCCCAIQGNFSRNNGLPP